MTRSTTDPARSRRVHRRWLVRGGALAAASALVLAAIPTAGAAAAAAAEPVPCTEVGGAWQIDATCVDPGFSDPVITSETDQTTPVPLHRVTGHIAGTAFNIYLPQKSQWQGRFFQHTYPTQTADAPDEDIAFGAASGAYTVTAAGSGGYRQEAALAKFAKTVAASYYGTDRRIYGYLYGASGGSFPTIGAIENTSGVWDGAVPIVMGSPMAIPNTFFIRAYARFVLESKVGQIADAMRPGGSGDPYAGLDPLQSSVLTEVTRLGLPLSGWVDPNYILGLTTSDGLLGFASTIRAFDPTYASDFWTAPGYLGTERSALGDYFRAARFDKDATIASVQQDATGALTSVTLSDAPSVTNPNAIDFSVTDARGTSLPVDGTLDANTKTVTLGTVNASTRALLQAGSVVHVDNSWQLALFAYHRYQTPTALDIHAWDQYRNPDGTPRYPVRAFRLGEFLASAVSGGASYSGAIKAKVIAVDDLVDVDSYPWQADWYSQRVRAAMGGQYDDSFRLWYFQSADHVGLDTTRVVSYTGFVEQALRDLSAWVERGVAPARSTKHTVTDDAQIEVGPNAAQRGGIQPSVDLTSHGSDRVDIRAGQSVPFTAIVQVPPGYGSVVRVEWDYEGTGTYTPAPFGPAKPVVNLDGSFRYDKPGTYYAAVRVYSQRDGNASEPYALIGNLDRIRVVVH